jgi:hypothetical protein
MSVETTASKRTGLDGEWVGPDSTLVLKRVGRRLMGTLTPKRGLAQNQRLEIVGFADPTPMRQRGEPRHLHQTVTFVVLIEDEARHARVARSYVGQHHEEPGEPPTLLLSWTETAEQQPIAGDLKELWYSMRSGVEQLARAEEETAS